MAATDGRMHILLPAVAFVIVVNVATISQFAADKRRAVAGARRIREADLLTLALIGGSPGAFFARHRYRHKTRKEPFSSQLWGIAIAQVVVAGAMGGYVLGG